MKRGGRGDPLSNGVTAIKGHLHIIIISKLGNEHRERFSFIIAAKADKTSFGLRLREEKDGETRDKRGEITRGIGG